MSPGVDLKSPLCLQTQEHLLSTHCVQRTGVVVGERKLKPLPYNEVFGSKQVLTEGGGEPPAARHLSGGRETTLENIPVTSRPRQQSTTRLSFSALGWGWVGGDGTHGCGVPQLL